jgi:hypothetical protein
MSNTPAYGCAQNDISFFGFTAAAGGSNTVGLSVPTTNDIYLYAGGTTDVYFNTPGAGPTWTVTNSGDQLDEVLAYTATTTGVFTTIGIPLTTSDFSGSGTFFTITLNYCVGQSTVTSCPAGQAGSFEVEVAGPSIVFNTGPNTLPSGYNMIAVSEELVMQNGYTLSTLPNEFGEMSPEPSTIILLGAGLVAIAFMHRRRTASVRVN